MRTVKILLVVVALGVVVTIYAWNYQSRNERLISAIEAGSALPVLRLQKLGERGELDQYSDRLGALLASELEAEWKPAIAAHTAKNPATLTLADLSTNPLRSETGLPASNRLQRLADIFMLTDPARNASPQIIERVARASLHFELIRDTRVLSGRDIPIGIAVYNATDAWTDNVTVGVIFEANEFFQIDRGISFGLTFGSIHLNGIPAPTRAELDFGVEMAEKLESTTSFPPSRRHSRYDTFLASTPVVKSLDWFDEIGVALSCTVNLYRADDELVASWSESISGQVSARQDMEEQAAAFELLLNDAVAGDAGSLNRLLALGAQGELGPFADLIGGKLSSVLDSNWRPLIEQHCEAKTPAAPAVDIPRTDSVTNVLLGIFFVSDPVQNASAQTWREVARAAVYIDQQVAIRDGKPIIRHHLYSPLYPTIMPNQVEALAVSVQGITLAAPIDRDWRPLGGMVSRVTVTSSDHALAHYGQTQASMLESSIAPEIADAMLANHDRPIQIESALDMQFLGPYEAPVVVWTEIVSQTHTLTPPVDQPLDETPQDRR